jgi:hypothetical protein
VTDSAALRVVSRPPTVRLTDAPTRAMVGRRLTIAFTTADALDELAQIATREGTFTRRYLIRNGTGVIEWIPTRAGRAVVHVRVRGRRAEWPSRGRRPDRAATGSWSARSRAAAP